MNGGWRLYRDGHDVTDVRVLWVFRFFRWYIAAGSNGTETTRIIWGRVEK